MVFHEKPQFWLRCPAPLSSYTTPFLAIITPFIISPTWVHIPPLGPHRVSSPLPLPSPWVKPGMIPQKLMQLKRKIKAYLATFNRKMNHKMQKMVETNTLNTWEKWFWEKWFRPQIGSLHLYAMNVNTLFRSGFRVSYRLSGRWSFCYAA